MVQNDDLNVCHKNQRKWQIPAVTPPLMWLLHTPPTQEIFKGICDVRQNTFFLWKMSQCANGWYLTHAEKKKSGGGRASIWSNSWDAPWDACVWVDCTPGSSFVFMGTLEGSTWWIGLGRVTCFGDPNLVLGFILAHLWILWACGEWTSRWEISNYLSKK